MNNQNFSANYVNLTIDELYSLHTIFAEHLILLISSKPLNNWPFIAGPVIIFTCCCWTWLDHNGFEL